MEKDHVLNKSLLCLKSSLSDLSNTYTTALLAYVFTLAEDMETRDHLLKQLDNSAIREGRLCPNVQIYITSAAAVLTFFVPSFKLTEVFVLGFHFLEG